MTKRDLVVRISQETGLIQQTVLEIIQNIFDYISEALAHGDKVELRNFGVFEIKVRKARVGRNPKAPAADVQIPARAVVKFKAGKKLGETVIKLTVPRKSGRTARSEGAEQSGSASRSGPALSTPA
jgi:nucleoid DNA-binding protein